MKYSFRPVVDENSRILILGSLPGERSLAEARYYAHPQNHFWKILYDFYGEDPAADFDSRYAFILRHRLALWDTVKCAFREGSLDGKIRGEVPNDIPALLREFQNIRLIIFNGACSFAKYKKHFGVPELPFRKLLSTSPACAGRNEERKKLWAEALSSLEKSSENRQ